MTDPVDDLIRDHMRDSFPRGDGSSAVLEELRPQMIRARSRRRVVQTSAGMATLSAVLIGALLVLPQLGGTPSQLDVAGPDGSGTVVEPENPKSLDSPATTDVLGRTIEEPSDQDADVVPSSPTVVPDATTTTTQTSTTAALTTTTTQTSTTTAQTSTTAAPRTTTTQTSGLITTPCGSLVAEIVGSGIGLVSTEPNPGFEAEVKNAGPAQIEVSFEGDEQPHCEVTVENRNGQIWSDLHEDDE